MVEQSIDNGGCPEMVVEILAPRVPWNVACDNAGTSVVVAREQHLLHEVLSGQLRKDCFQHCSAGAENAQTTQHK
jgi:hypothetical protein